MEDKKKPNPKHAEKVVTQKRIDDLLRIRLDGAEWIDIREFVRIKETEQGSNWLLGENEAPLSDSQIRRLLARADELMYVSHERSRKKLYRRHLAQRRNLYAKATTSGDIRTALAVLQDEATLLGLYPKAKIEHSGTVTMEVTEVVVRSREEAKKAVSALEQTG